MCRNLACVPAAKYKPYNVENIPLARANICILFTVFSDTGRAFFLNSKPKAIAPLRRAEPAANIKARFIAFGEFFVAVILFL